MQEIVFPTSLQVMKNGVFARCQELRQVTIPASLHEIGGGTFSDCYNLTNVTFLGDAPFCDAPLFENANRDLVVYVPVGSKGWDGNPESTALPKYWPFNTEGGRRIVHIGESVEDEPSVVTTIVHQVAAPYSITNAPADRAIASVTVDSDCAIDEFVLKDGKVYDCVLRIVNTAGHDVKLTLPSGYVYETIGSASPLVLPASSKSLLTITRTADRTFLVTRQTLNVIQ